MRIAVNFEEPLLRFGEYAELILAGTLPTSPTLSEVQFKTVADLMTVRRRSQTEPDAQANDNDEVTKVLKLRGAPE